MTNTEPSADIREMASAMWQMFVAYQREGFTVEQSMRLLLAPLMKGPSSGENS